MAKFSRPRVINDETNDETFRQDGAPVVWLLATLMMMVMIGLVAACLTIAWQVVVG
jgi:hypothetical protein